MKPFGLPVDAVLKDLGKALAEHPCAVLEALPGAGKTTCIPLALLNEPWLGNQKMIVLAPRRLAARAAAMRMSHLLEETVGQTVGYRIRMDSRVSARTRIEVVTEGVLTRMLQSDPSLKGVGLIIFDEFHERSLDADLGLALCLDMELRVDLMRAALQNHPLAIPGGTVDKGALGNAVRVSRNLCRRLGVKEENGGAGDLGRLLALAYPDRIAQLRPGSGGKFLLSSGRGAFLDETSPLGSEPFLVAAELDGKGSDARIYKAAPVPIDTLMKQFQDLLEWSESVSWDAERGRVKSERHLKLGAISLRSERLSAPDSEKVLNVFLEGIKEKGIGCLPWRKHLRRWQERVCFLRRLLKDDNTWPDVSDQWLESNLKQWLAPYLANMDRLSDLARIDLKGGLFSILSYPQQKAVDALAPAHLVVPSGSRIPIDYGSLVPVLAVRLQEMFGLSKTPTVAGGRQPLLIHLLSPAGRPVQITADLAGFWERGYIAVKKELKGRYPKHYWPHDPLKAKATTRVRT